MKNTDFKIFHVEENICNQILEFSKTVEWVTAKTDPVIKIYDFKESDLLNSIKQFILKYAEDYLDKYREFDKDKQIGKLSEKNILFLRLTKYDINSYFSSHIDVSYPHNKDLSFVLYLNEQTSKIYFPNQDITIETNKGNLLVFPSYFNYPHETIPCDFEKTVLVCWVSLNLGAY